MCWKMRKIIKGTPGMTDTSEHKKLQIWSLSPLTLLLLLMPVCTPSLANGWRKMLWDGR
jgi:hypothetical protein